MWSDRYLERLFRKVWKGGDEKINDDNSNNCYATFESLTRISVDIYEAANLIFLQIIYYRLHSSRHKQSLKRQKQFLGTRKFPMHVDEDVRAHDGLRLFFFTFACESLEIKFYLPINNVNIFNSFLE